MWAAATRFKLVRLQYFAPISAWVAHMRSERWSEKPQVVGSTPTPGTIYMPCQLSWNQSMRLLPAESGVRVSHRVPKILKKESDKMRIVNTGSNFKIYDNSLKTFDSLPIQSYIVRYDKMSGFFLESYPNIEITEKIYGVHKEKVAKVMKSFEIFDRNLGVILSGEKGIGKSICAKLLAEDAVAKGYPLIVVNQYIPGIADYITSIEQEVVVLFDEFDKTFFSGDRDSIGDPQTEMLTLFDGLSMGKKLFVVTCN